MEESGALSCFFLLPPSPLPSLNTLSAALLCCQKEKAFTSGPGVHSSVAFLLLLLLTNSRHCLPCLSGRRPSRLLCRQVSGHGQGRRDVHKRSRDKYKL